MEPHTEVLIKLGEISGDINRLNEKVGIQNGSVAKHEQRLNQQDVMNAQTTMTQQKILEEIKNINLSRDGESKEKSESGKKWTERVIWSIVVPGVSFLIILSLTKLGIINLQ